MTKGGFFSRSHDLGPVGAPAGVVLHEVPLEDHGRVILDVGTGQATHLDDECADDPADPIVTRWAYLSWCRDTMPLPTPACLWTVESAALAARSNVPGVRATTTSGLAEALHDLQSSSVPWPATVTGTIDSLHATMTRTSPAPDSIEHLAGVLDDLVQEIRAAVASPGPTPVGFVLDTQSPVGFEPEWDRTKLALIDPREHTIRGRVDADHWTVSAAALPHSAPSGGVAGSVWARLIDARTLTIAAQGQMTCRHGTWAYTGPITAPVQRPWRIDLTTQPDRRPRRPEDLALCHATQGVFRALALNRTVGTTHPNWCQTQTQRATRCLRRYLDIVGDSCSTGTIDELGGNLSAIRTPFLAEKTITPDQLCHIVSPPRHDPWAATLRPSHHGGPVTPDRLGSRR